MSQNRSIWSWIAGLVGVGALAGFAIAAHQGTVLPSVVSAVLLAATHEASPAPADHHATAGHPAGCGAEVNVADLSLTCGAQVIYLPLPGAIALAFANLFWLGIRLRRYA